MSRLWSSVTFVVWLLGHVIKGSAQVAWRVLTPGLAATSAIVEHHLHCRTDLEITLFGSAVTITPGTVVLGIAAAGDDHGPVVYVHCLFGGGREALLAGLRDLEGRLLRCTRGRSAVMAA